MRSLVRLRLARASSNVLQGPPASAFDPPRRVRTVSTTEDPVVTVKPFRRDAGEKNAPGSNARDSQSPYRTKEDVEAAMLRSSGGDARDTSRQLVQKPSRFKEERRQLFREDKHSQYPLWKDIYPRLDSNLGRISVPDFLEQFEEYIGTEHIITLCGRIRSKRVIGKGLIFLDIVNEFQRVQVMLNKNKTSLGNHMRIRRFALFNKLIQVGDHISVAGVATRTQSGEATLEASDLPCLLSPSMEPLPEKLINESTRMHDRHVDMLVNKEVLDILRLKAEITKHMRSHFVSKRFLEFQTPILAEGAGGATARPFVTRSEDLRGRNLSLRIAPELWLKRLVVGGVDKVFEIGPVFRNEGINTTHNPEFTICEFYSAYVNLSDLIKETEELICDLAQHCQNYIATQSLSLPPIDLTRFSSPFKQIEFVPALQEAMGIRLPKLTSEDALGEMLAVLKLAGIDLPGDVPTSLGKLLDRLSTLYLEPLSMKSPLLIKNHPTCMSPLAKSFLCPNTYQLVSARAELYIDGRELANMYEEENDPREQRRKLAFHQSLINKSDGNVGFDPIKSRYSASAVGQRDHVPQQIQLDQEAQLEDDAEEWLRSSLDENYVRALDYGLPPTGGWGCGVERLVMLFSGAHRIGDCLSFGTLRNVAGLGSDERATGAQARAAKKPGSATPPLPTPQPEPESQV